ncbi:MAG: hypothetical protein ACTS6J_24960 [Burkholderiales bacterium]
MNPAAHRIEDNASGPVLYMALELSNKSWRLIFGGGGKRRQVSLPAGDSMKLSEAVGKAKERFGMLASTPVVTGPAAGLEKNCQ